MSESVAIRHGAPRSGSHASGRTSYTTFVTGNSPIDRADWRLRSPELHALRTYNDGRPIVVMEFEPAEPDRVDEWLWLRQLWLDLPPHAHILDAIDRGAGADILLRYAAIDWQREPVDLEANARRVATWGAQITGAYRSISSALSATELGHFLRPLIKLDLTGNVRLAFLPIDRSDPRLPPRWPECNEHAVMNTIGRAIGEFCVGSAWISSRPAVPAEIGEILRRCVQPQPPDRYTTLEELEAAWILSPPARDSTWVEAWERTQEGIGWLELGQSRHALHEFRSAIDLQPHLGLAKAGRDRALDALGDGPIEPTKPRASWPDVADEGLRLESAHEFLEALSIYGTVVMDGVNDTELEVACARCHLGLGAAGHAIDYAVRALTRNSSHLAALSVATRAHLLARRCTDALRIAEEWIAIDQNDANAHYARGRGLLALGRFVEARDAFDRASSLRPQMLEAMLLRREADRSVRRLTEEVGIPRPMTIDVPEHLAALRDALVSGRVHDVIPFLERSEYSEDAIAKLVHAECLAFDQRFEESLELYDRATALSPDQRPRAVAGKVRALLALDLVAEALAALDAAEDLVDVERVELRGLALYRLGLPDDAERELGRVVAASGGRSDLRVGRRDR